MKKLESDWNGTVFAAGLERINLKPDDFIDLDWMIPCSTRTMVIVAMQNDAFTLNALSQLNDRDCIY
jgi:hydroxymethylbilane synthase